MCDAFVSSEERDRIIGRDDQKREQLFAQYLRELLSENVQIPEDRRDLVAEFVRKVWGDDVKLGNHRNNESRRKEWVQFWTGYGFGDKLLIQKAWGGSAKIMQIMDFESVCYNAFLVSLSEVLEKNCHILTFS